MHMWSMLWHRNDLEERFLMDQIEEFGNEPNDRLMYLILLFPMVTERLPSGCGTVPLI